MLLFGVGALCLLTNTGIVLKFYPLFMNLLFLGTFGITLILPPPMIYRFAVLQDKSIPGSLMEKRIAAYCRKVTIVWVLFFIFNGGMAAWTIFFGSDFIWSIYNGGISYILIGILFAGEFFIRRKEQKNMPKFIPLSEIKKDSRDSSAVICYDGVWSDNAHKTWADFLEGTAALRRKIETVSAAKWLLYCDDSWLFLLAFTALLQCKKEVMLTANPSPAYVTEIRDGAPFISDRLFPVENIYHIPAILGEKSEDGKKDIIPVIDSGEAYVVFFTSGTTGEPKMVRQRLKEFEIDNRNILGKWGEEFYSRKLCCTVTHQHIYGFLFSVLLPFTAGVPFRTQIIKTPEEFERFSDTGYLIITVPAFLKRAVEMDPPLRLSLKTPWILSSGGLLTPDVAKKASDSFGFWPLEMYGSTETSGVGWRQSCNGIEWSPFGNAELSVNEYNCLVVRSPYIKDENSPGDSSKIGSFETSDLVKILPDGRFILMGRLDSLVKIEEIRVSLVEMESRITQSGLVSDVSVVPMEDKRQYLAAALVFNAKGQDEFKSLEKDAINKYWREYLSKYFESPVVPKKWRYVDALPVDSQGKKKKEDIERLFSE